MRILNLCPPTSKYPDHWHVSNTLSVKTVITLNKPRQFVDPFRITYNKPEAKSSSGREGFCPCGGVGGGSEVNDSLAKRRFFNGVMLSGWLGGDSKIKQRIIRDLIQKHQDIPNGGSVTSDIACLSQRFFPNSENPVPLSRGG